MPYPRLMKDLDRLCRATKPGPNECMLFTGFLVHNGYGKFRRRQEYWRAHRAMWDMCFGPIPPDQQVLHKCDVRHCVNPDHLFLGSHKDNMADMIRKGRQASAAKRTDGLVDRVREMAASGVAFGEIARKLGISRTYASRLSRGIRGGSFQPTIKHHPV